MNIITVCSQLFQQHLQLSMQISKSKCFPAFSVFYDRTSICIYTCSPSPLSHSLLFVLTASQSNSSLKKQRSRSIFSTFFCCFRNYNVDPPATNTNTSPQPPPVEENGSPPKVGCSATKHMPFVCFSIFVDLFICPPSYPSTCFFLCVCLSCVVV